MDCKAYKVWYLSQSLLADLYAARKKIKKKKNHKKTPVSNVKDSSVVLKTGVSRTTMKSNAR